jgi:hypothetical protein
VFSFLVASGFWKTLKSLTYIYFFPFVLVIYALYALGIGLKAVNKWFKKQAHFESESQANPTQSPPLLIGSTAPQAEPVGAHQREASQTARQIVLFLLRPFTRFMFLWCILLLTTTHRGIVWLCLVVVSVHLARKIFFILKLLFFSGPWFAKLWPALPTGLYQSIEALASVTNDSPPTNDLKNLWSQLNLWKKMLNFLKNPYMVSRWAWLLGILVFGLLYLYIAVLFSFVYYGIARVNGIPYSWPDALVSSVFIPFFVSDLPKLLVMRIIGGIHCVLVLTVGIGTVVNFLRRKLDAMRKAASELSHRLAEQSLQEKYLILEQKMAATNVTPPTPPPQR